MQHHANSAVAAPKLDFLLDMIEDLVKSQVQLTNTADTPGVTCKTVLHASQMHVKAPMLQGMSHQSC